jgi:hypothetical protein
VIAVLHPVTTVLGGLVMHPLDQARDLLHFYRDFCATLPDEAEAYAGLVTLPEGTPAAALILGYNGAMADAEGMIARSPRSHSSPDSASVIHHDRVRIGISGKCQTRRMRRVLCPLRRFAKNVC